MNAPRDFLLLFVVIAMLLATSARATEEEIQPDADPLNPAFAAYIGSGIYVVNGRSAYLIRFPLKARLRSEEDHKFGLILRINASLGYYDLKAGDLGKFFDIAGVSTVAVIPGIEFPMRLQENWTLGPFFDIGGSYDSVTYQITGVMGTGIRSRAEFAKRYLLWNELVYGNNLSTGTVFDDFLMLRTRFDIRRLAEFRVFGHTNDFGLLFQNDSFVNALRFLRPEGDERITRVRWEVGFTIGPTEKTRFFKKLITAPRVGLSYRFGDGSRAVRFILTARY